MGALSLSLAAALYLAILFGVAGVISGILIGGINGIVLSIVTIAFGNRINNFNMLALITSIIVAFIVGWYWFLNILKSYSVTGAVDWWILLVPVVSAIATLAYASRRVSVWYLRSIALVTLAAKSESKF